MFLFLFLTVYKTHIAFSDRFSWYLWCTSLFLVFHSTQGSEVFITFLVTLTQTLKQSYVL
jgi:hypothetical protein